MISNKKLLLLFVCLSLIICERSATDDECDDVSGDDTKKEDCTDYKLTKLEKARGNACCYVETTYKSGTAYKGCNSYVKKAVTKDYIKEYIEYQNKGESDDKYIISSYSVDCGCNWLSLSMILAFLLLLF